MKFIPALILCMIGLSTFAINKEDMQLQPLEYSIVSDVKDKKIKKGKFIIEGTLKMFSSANPLEGAQIGLIDSKKSVKSDKEGKFTIELNHSDSIAVYFFKKGWSEVVIDNYKFQNRHRVNVDVYLVQDRQDVKRKPVIYMYNEVDLQAHLALDPLGEFIFTYPNYAKEGWECTINKDGITVEDQTYPYLFWEAKSPAMDFEISNGKMEGFLINSNNTIDFLEEKLDLVGFNQREKADFITYWGPIMQQEEFALIQFVQDEDYNNEICTLEIFPKPDNSKRLFMKYMPLKTDKLNGVEALLTLTR